MQNEDLVSQLSELLTLAKDGKLSGGVGVFYFSKSRGYPAEMPATVMSVTCDAMRSQMPTECGIRWTAAAAIEVHLNVQFGG